MAYRELTVELPPASLQQKQSTSYEITPGKSYSSNLYEAQYIVLAEHSWCKNNDILIS